MKRLALIGLIVAGMFSVAHASGAPTAVPNIPQKKEMPTLDNTSKVLIATLDGRIKGFVFIGKTGAVVGVSAENCAGLKPCVDLVTALLKKGAYKSVSLESDCSTDGPSSLPNALKTDRIVKIGEQE